MKKLVAVFAFAALLTPTFAHAQDRHDHGGGHAEWHQDEHWHGDIHTFHNYDMAYWRGGHWYHGWHGGRNGWWWALGPNWYFYSSPVYPYPSPYAPGMMAPPPAGASYWYYCHSPAGYYPYVPACAGPWHEVPTY